MLLLLSHAKTPNFSPSPIQKCGGTLTCMCSGNGSRPPLYLSCSVAAVSICQSRGVSPRASRQPAGAQHPPPSKLTQQARQRGIQGLWSATPHHLQSLNPYSKPCSNTKQAWQLLTWHAAPICNHVMLQIMLCSGEKPHRQLQCPPPHPSTAPASHAGPLPATASSL